MTQAVDAEFSDAGTAWDGRDGRAEEVRGYSGSRRKRWVVLVDDVPLPTVLLYIAFFFSVVECPIQPDADTTCAVALIVAP